MTSESMTSRHHTVTVLVENKPAVLARVASLFSRRAYNIFSLAVAPTDDPRFSRITIVVDVDESPLEQVIKQLDKLIPVVSIRELSAEGSCQRELLLATVEVGDARSELDTLLGEHKGAVVDEGQGQVTVSVAGAPDDLDRIEARLGSFGIVELQRTGRIALPRLA